MTLGSRSKNWINALTLIAAVFYFFEKNGATLFDSTFYGPLCFTLISFAGVLAIEGFALGWSSSSIRRMLTLHSESTKNDIVMSISNQLGLTSLISQIFALSLIESHAERISGVIKSHLDVTLLSFVSNPIANVFLYTLLSSLITYWYHRLIHRVPALWELHKVHHSSRELNVITIDRQHPLEKLILMAFKVVPAALLGMPVQVFAAVSTVIFVQQLLVHSSVGWSWGWFGKYCIGSPRGHHIHHSNDSKHWNRNFDSMFPIWDHLFGTYYHDDGEKVDFGISKEAEHPPPPMIEFAVRAFASVKTALSRLRVISERKNPFGGVFERYL